MHQRRGTGNPLRQNAVDPGFHDVPAGAAARHDDERGLAALILMIATTNFFNRLNVSTRQPARARG